MICRSCLTRRALTLRPANVLPRTFSTSALRPTAAPAAQEFSTPLTPAPHDAAAAKPKAKPQSPKSAAPEGTVLKGLNYIKGRDDPVAKAEEEYPEWLWRCLDVKSKKSEADDAAGNEFSKSKKQRRLAAKRQRKLEEQMIASGNLEAFVPKIPIQEQTIDLPANKGGTLDGAIDAVNSRTELTRAMRAERRSKIKEANFLKGVK